MKIFLRKNYQILTAFIFLLVIVLMLLKITMQLSELRDVTTLVLENSSRAVQYSQYAYDEAENASLFAEEAYDAAERAANSAEYCEYLY